MARKPKENVHADEPRCSIENCGKRHLARGFCTAHYKRWKRHGDPLGGGTSLGAPGRWLEAALLLETDQCVEWPYGRKEGYGFLNDGNGGTITASRWVCVRAHGEPPQARMEAAHSCGNRGCCNSRHIRWATFVENSADKLIHGTQLMGEAVPAARFTADDVRQIRAAHAGGETYASIGRRFGTTTTHVRNIVLRIIWKHVDQERIAA